MCERPHNDNMTARGETRGAEFCFNNSVRLFNFHCLFIVYASCRFLSESPRLQLNV